MLLVEIEGSTAVKAAGFENGVIRILFVTGHWKDFVDCTAADFDAFLAAPSKGRFVQEKLVRRPSAARTLNPTALDTFHSDPCCSTRLSRAIAAGIVADLEEWSCPNCGSLWTAKKTSIGRHWEPRPWMAVFR